MNDNSITSNDDLMIAIQHCIQMLSLVLEMESAVLLKDKDGAVESIKNYAKQTREQAVEVIDDILKHKTACLGRGTYDTDKRSAQASDS